MRLHFHITCSFYQIDTIQRLKKLAVIYVSNVDGFNVFAGGFLSGWRLTVK